MPTEIKELIKKDFIESLNIFSDKIAYAIDSIKRLANSLNSRKLIKGQHIKGIYRTKRHKNRTKFIIKN